MVLLSRSRLQKACVFVPKCGTREPGWVTPKQCCLDGPKDLRSEIPIDDIYTKACSHSGADLKLIFAFFRDTLGIRSLPQSINAVPPPAPKLPSTEILPPDIPSPLTQVPPNIEDYRRLLDQVIAAAHHSQFPSYHRNDVILYPQGSSHTLPQDHGRQFHPFHKSMFRAFSTECKNGHSQKEHSQKVGAAGELFVSGSPWLNVHLS
jgi:hypothetical protein